MAKKKSITYNRIGDDPNHWIKITNDFLEKIYFLTERDISNEFSIFLIQMWKSRLIPNAYVQKVSDDTNLKIGNILDIVKNRTGIKTAAGE